MTDKERMEAQWRASGVGQANHIARWDAGVYSTALWPRKGKPVNYPDKQAAQRQRQRIKWGNIIRAGGIVLR